MSWDDVFKLLGIGYLILVGIAVVWFWIKMLIEAASERKAGSRVAWILIVFFGGLLGAIAVTGGVVIIFAAGIDGRIGDNQQTGLAVGRQFQLNFAHQLSGKAHAVP